MGSLNHDGLQTFTPLTYDPATLPHEAVMSWLHAIPYPQINPVFLELGPLQFRWYGLMYLLGLTGAYFLIKARVAAKGLPLSREQIYDMVVWAALGVFIGGRLGYTLFYNFPYYFSTQLKSLPCGRVGCPSTAVSWEPLSPCFGTAHTNG